MPRSFSPDRKVYRQYEFTPVVGPTDLSRLEPIGTRNIVIKESSPEWLSLSATQLRTLATLSDHEDAGSSQRETLDDLERRTQQQLAGTALHTIEEHLTIWDSLQPSEWTEERAWRAYRKNMDDRLPKLLPTTPPEEVRAIRKRLENPKLALTDVEQTPEAIRTCHDLIAQRVLADLSDKAPLAGTEPIPFAEQSDDITPFLKPSAIQDRWERRTVPWLRANIGLLLASHHLQSQILGRELSDPNTGFFYDLPEVRVDILAYSLEFTLSERIDKMTRLPAAVGTTLKIRDLKAGRRVYSPPPDSWEEIADNAIVYLTAIALTESHGYQKKDGYGVKFHTDTGVDHPRTISPFDDIEFSIVAIGQRPPEVVNKAKEYESILTDPFVAQAVLVRTEALLNRIRDEKHRSTRYTRGKP